MKQVWAFSTSFPGWRRPLAAEHMTILPFFRRSAQEAGLAGVTDCEPPEKPIVARMVSERNLITDRPDELLENERQLAPKPPDSRSKRG